MTTISHLWRSSRGCCLVLAILLLLLILGGCVALGFALARVTEAAEVDGLDVMLIVDQSGSLWELNGVGTDPAMMRMEAARLLASYLGVDGPLSDYRLGLIYFGTAPKLVMPLTSLTKNPGGREAALDTLNHPPESMGWTDVNAALSLAYQELYDSQRSILSHAKAVILFTDGRAQTAANSAPTSEDAYMAELRQWVRRFSTQGATFSTLLLVNPVTDPDPQMAAVYRPLWNDLAASGTGVRFYDVHAGEDLLNVYHDLTVQMQVGETEGHIVNELVDGQAQATIIVPPGWQRMTLVLRRSHPALSLSLLRPDGRLVSPSDPGVQRRSGAGQIEIWSIDHPEPGNWSLHAQGQGALTAWLDYYPLPATPTPLASPTPSATPSPTAEATTAIFAPGPVSAAGVALASMVTPAPTVAAINRTSDLATGVPSWGWIAFAGLGVATVGALGLYSARRQSPALEGKLYVVQAPAGEQNGRCWDLGESRRSKVILGTGRDCGIVLAHDPALLPKTAVIQAEQDADGPMIPVLADLSGRQLAHVQGQAPGLRQRLQDGALIQVGAYQLRYENLVLRRAAASWRPPSNLSFPGQSR